MVFSSPIFVSLFLPAVFLLCLLLRNHIRAQNACLCVLSLVFYGWGEPWGVLLILLSALLNGWLARRIAAAGNARHKNGYTLCAVLLNMGALFAFKYAGFFLGIPPLPLPLGISFFTFQALSYVLDVRMGRVDAPVGYGRLLLYLCLFPQLIAGPIVQWRDIAPQLDSRRMTADGAAQGLMRFTIGLSKKVLLADTLARVADAAFATPADGLGAPLAWLGAIAYTLQIYLDFSGYSDMAIGMGRMLGFTFAENFRRPLRAKSMGDFWRRWHITLTDWFRHYVYIPLGGNRRGQAVTVRNLTVVFLLTGLWHGAAWTFILWGMWHGLFVILERVGAIQVRRWPRWAGHAYTLLVVIAGFVLFRADSVAHAGAYLWAMLAGFARTPLTRSHLLAQLTPMNLAMLAIAIPVGLGVSTELRPRWLGYALCAALLILSYASMLASGYHPFIYFRF